MKLLFKIGCGCVKLICYMLFFCVFIALFAISSEIGIVLGFVYLVYLIYKHSKKYATTQNSQANAPFYALDADGLMTPDAYSQMRHDQIAHLEALYDLNTVEGINSIPVPKVRIKSGSPSVTGQIEYYLSGIKGGTYEKNGQIELALACYRKANDLMPFSHFEYLHSEYMKLPRYLRKLRRFDEARVEEGKIDSFFAERNAELDLRASPAYRLNAASDILYGSDLVETSFHLAVCPECAKFRNRRYSMYGRDLRYPRYPEFLKNNPFHCNLSYFPVIHGVQTMYDYNNVPIDPIAHSNRPFIDDRTDEEKDNYLLECKRVNNELQMELDRKDYDWLWEHMPEICPKSFGGYRKMKNSNSKNYQEIQAHMTQQLPSHNSTKPSR